MTRKDKIGFVWVDLDSALDSVSEAKKGFIKYRMDLGFTKEQNL